MQDDTTARKLEAVSDIVMGLKGRADFASVNGYYILAYTAPIVVIPSYDRNVPEFINVAWVEPPRHTNPSVLGFTE